MSLVFIGFSVADLKGINFQAKEGNKIIRCGISDEALQDIFGARRNSMNTFEANLGRIQSKASTKYNAGQLEHDGSVYLRARDFL